MAEEKKRSKYVNYIRKPLAKGGFYAAGITAVGLVLFVSVNAMSVNSRYNVPLNLSSMAFSSLLFALCGLIYGIRAMWEKEKNYILAKLSVILDGLMILVWVIMLIVGLRMG